MLHEAEAHNPKFGFLKAGDVYRPYYLQKIEEYKSGSSEAVPVQAQIQEQPNTQVLAEQPAQVQNLEPKRIVRQPPPEQYSVVHPYIPILDRETIKLTAQFVARNGQKFLTGLTERESKNPQFDFLKPTHILFGYFTSLVDAYSKCLVPRKDELIKLQKYIDDANLILDQGIDRYEWEKMKMLEERKKRDEKSKVEEDEAMQIDWHDFVTVETITFDDDVFLEQREGVQTIPISSEKIQKETKAEEMEMDMENEDYKSLAAVAKKVEAQKQAEEIVTKPQAVLPPPPPMPKIAEKEEFLEPGMKIKANYERKPDTGPAKEKCPKCGQMIPKEEFEKHMQIEMTSPAFFQARKEMFDRTEGRAIASGDEIIQNLQEFASNRPDLYGDIKRQLPSSIIKEEVEKKEKTRFQYDGSLGLTRSAANIAMLASQNKKNIDLATKGDLSNMADLAAAPTRKVLNLLSQSQQQSNVPGLSNMPPRPSMPIPPPPTMAPPQMPGSVSAAPIFNPLGFLRPGMQTSMNLAGGLLTADKYKAEEESSLIPEDQWLKYYPGSITINIKVPNGGGEKDWNFMGQILRLSMDPRTKVKQLKEAISTYLGNMPPTRMKLKAFNRNALKDDFSLAHFNILSGTTLELSTKERGGRAKK